MKDCVLAIDEGTTGVTALVLGPDRRVLGRAYAEVPQSYPKPGWVEQDPLVILATVETVGVQALRAAGVAASRLAGIGIANQRETTVLWDRRTGTPVAPAIVWQDKRTSTRCETLKPDWSSTVRRKTGLVLDPYFSATKLEWLLRDAKLKARAKKGELAFGTVDAWLAARLVGRHATDVTNASRTLLWNIRKGDWDDELLELFGLPAALLPEVLPSSGVVGDTNRFGGNVPVAALVGDQQAALFGQGCTRPGEAKCTYGTGAFILQHTGSSPVASRHGLLITRAASLDAKPQFALEGAVFTAGAAIQWLRDQLGFFATAPEVNALAAQVPDSGGVVAVPAFTGLGAPHWDPEARGALLGLSRGTDRRHIARAMLDAIAFQCADVLAAMEKDSGKRLPRLRVDGGASQSDLLLQTQADILQRPVVRPANVETTAMGAGFLAGIATGLWSRDDAREPTRGDLEVRPLSKPAAVARQRKAWSAAVAAMRAFKPQT